jgi:lipoprotein LprG
MLTPMLKRATVVTVLSLLILGATGCSGDDGDDGSSKGADLSERLATARTTLDDAESLAISLSTEKLPADVTGLLEAQGKGNHSPAFTGTVKVALKGVPVGAEVVSVDGAVLVKTGFAPDFVPMDPASLGAPDPATLMKTDGGLSALLTETDDLEDGGKSRDGREVLTTIKGTIPGSVVSTLIPTAQESETFDATYRLTDDDTLRDVVLKGLFYDADEPVTYTVAVTASDKPVEITAP